jgi:PAS domain S-box-containing protein
MSGNKAVEMPRRLRVLILEDTPSDVELAVMELRRAGYTPEWECVETEEAFLEKLQGNFDIILSDYSMPQFDGIRALRLVRGQGVQIPFILVSGTMGEETAVAAMKEGASDYLLKDRLARLGPAVAQALEQTKLRRERERAEEATRQSEERMRAVLESALDCVITMDHEGSIVEFNPAAEKTFGYTRSEAIGRLLADLIIPASLRERHQRGLQHYLSTGEAPVLGKRIQLMGMRSDRSEFPVELGITRIGSHEPPMFTGFIRDITEQKQAEERLREQADIINRAHDAIIVRDFGTGRVTFWNAGAQRLYGWTAEEAVGRSIGDLIFADPGQLEPLTKTLISSGEFRGEIRQVTQDKKDLIVDGRATLVRDPDGSPRSVLIINTDITEHKKLETQLLRAQRLESIGTLASGVAHDLNNILAPILMGAAVLRRSEMDSGDEAILSTIETCAQRGADIVKQVLTFARGAEGERLPLQAEPLIRDVAKIAEETFPKKITVRFSFPQSLWSILGDPTQLHQVLLNLSVNARDAMPAGGTLSLSADNFPVDEHYASMTPGATAGPHVRFEVTDTGMGIPAHNLDKIFDPFFTTKELGHGTGLGLSSVVGIVKSHGGFMSVYSEIGRGTTFKVYLPANVSALETKKETAATVLPPANGELLLLVDDEKAILQVAQALLEAQGYAVLTAEDATAALAIFAIRKDDIKLVLTDLAMPLMDGIALIRTLQKMKPDVRVIASTGRGGQEQHAHELEDLNVRVCLTKPYNKNKLLKTLHDALNPKTY